VRRGTCVARARRDPRQRQAHHERRETEGASTAPIWTRRQAQLGADDRHEHRVQVPAEREQRVERQQALHRPVADEVQHPAAARALLARPRRGQRHAPRQQRRQRNERHDREQRERGTVTRVVDRDPGEERPDDARDREREREQREALHALARVARLAGDVLQRDLERRERESGERRGREQRRKARRERRERDRRGETGRPGEHRRARADAIGIATNRDGEDHRQHREERDKQPDRRGRSAAGERVERHVDARAGQGDMVHDAQRQQRRERAAPRPGSVGHGASRPIDQPSPSRR
jgi:hypothetical protein